MLTTDLSLRFDPAYEKISRRFHGESGPVRRRVRPRLVQAHAPRHGPDACATSARSCRRKTLIWQDPIPAVDHPLVGDKDIAALKAKILASGLSVSAARLDRLGVGVDVPRLRQARRRQWRAHPPRAAEGLGGQPAGAAARPCWQKLEAIQKEFGKKVSLADLIVLGGCAAVEKAAKDAGVDVKVPFTPGRMDASQEQTDVESFAPLEPRADGFRNYINSKKRSS